VTRDTLLYGSADGGLTACERVDNDAACEAAEQLAKVLNLRQHR
jgi:hypothetical protein